MKLKIGNVELKNNIILAPLAGITDGPFRRICSEMGAGLTCSEMVSAKGMWYHDKNTEHLLRVLPGEGPIAYQIFGHEPDIIAAAARDLESRENVILDINMGCPVPKIVKNGEGSALLKDPDLVYEIVRAAVHNTSKPVTVKMRTGWDDENITVIEAANAAEAAGASAVAVHGRTRAQYYSGKADWGIIARVKKSLKIPVIGNGDIFSIEDADRMIEETGVDGVMVARGALGNPWIFSGRTPALEEKKQVMIRQLTDTAELKGEHVAVREMRKHVGWYLKGEFGAAAFRGIINKIDDFEELKNAIADFGGR